MDNDRYELLCLLEQLYLERGVFPTRDYLVGIGVSGRLYDKCIKDKAFREGLLERGVRLAVIDGVDPDNWKSFALTEEQLTTANVLLDLTDQRSRAKKLAEIGISTSKYQSWLKDPAFQKYLRLRSEGALEDNQHEAHLALIDKVTAGDVNAIKYFNELTGRFVQAKDSNIDINTILMRVVEIVQKHVKDGEALAAIGNDMIALSDALRSGGNGLPAPVVVKEQRVLVSAQPVGDDV